MRFSPVYALCRGQKRVYLLFSNDLSRFLHFSLPFVPLTRGQNHPSHPNLPAIYPQTRGHKNRDLNVH